MNDSALRQVIQELRARRLLAASAEPTLLPTGNQDRREALHRISLRAQHADGSEIRLVVARDLADLARRQQEFARACPALVPAPIFHAILDGAHAFADRFFPGETLDAIAARNPAVALAAVATVRNELHRAQRPSTEENRAAEWATCSEALLRLALWSPAELLHLRNDLLPALQRVISATPPQLRWTNGDFFSGNILVDPAGQVRLIDAEFAHETHFAGEDAARFFTLSPCARRLAPELGRVLPAAGPAWQLFFWLRQLTLEATNNTPEYLERVRAVRLATIRQLSETALQVALPHWSEPPRRVEHALEVLRGDPDGGSSLRIGGWAHVPGSAFLRFSCHQNVRLTCAAPVARPDVQAHFQGDPNALAAGFDLTAAIENDTDPVFLTGELADGTELPIARFEPRSVPGRSPRFPSYTEWARRHDPNPPPSQFLPAGPKFSVLLPVHNTPPAFLAGAIGSVLGQHYPHWELIVVDDGSTHPATLAELARHRADSRVILVRRDTNGGIARASNDALNQARGDYVVLLDHDDLLRPHALAEFATALVAHPEWDAAYSDEDKISADGTRLLPLLKPGFSSEFLLGVMYLGHALCVRTSVARAVGGFDPRFDGVQDYEFMLRVTERTRRIGHIPRMLYHWRQSPTSSALQGNIKGDMDALQLAAVRAHLGRLGRSDNAVSHGGHRVKLRTGTIPDFAVVRGGDTNPLAALAADRTAAPILIWVGTDVASVDEPTLRELAGVAALSDSGIVGPMLVSREGWVFAAGERADGTPLMRGFDPAGDGYHGSLACRREVARVSSTCFAVRRALLVGHDGSNWADFCTDLRRTGLFHRICPDVRVAVAQPWNSSPTRTTGPVAEDAFFNPHFDGARGDYTLASPPPHFADAVWHLDTPVSALSGHGSVLLRGWAFGSSGQHPCGIRLRAGPLVLPGVLGFPRPDVKRSLPEAPDDSCGFEIRGALPPGSQQVELEIAFMPGRWNVVLRTTAEVRPHFPPLWLGGGSWQDLMFFQMPGHAKHAPRPVSPERFAPPPANSKAPKIAIVTPSFGQAAYLATTMDAVLSQADVQCDYVVQDGGSTDGSASIIRARADRLAAYEIARDAGQADAIAKGFAKTSGSPDDVMAWINSDDFYLPGALAFVANYFARHPEVDVIYGHRIVVDEEDREIARWFLPQHDPEVLRLNDFVPQETLFWRRRIWDRVGGIDPSFNFAMDWDLLLRMQAAGAKIVRVPYFLACFRVHAAQKTTAQMHSVGQAEIERLRERTFGRPVPAHELEAHPRLLRYLRSSALLEFAWRNIGLRLR